MVKLANSMTLSRKLEGQDVMVNRQDLYYYFMAFTWTSVNLSYRSMQKLKANVSASRCKANLKPHLWTVKRHHDCCDVCHSECQCLGHGCQVDLLKVITEEAPKILKRKKTRNVELPQKEELRELLDDYQEELKEWCCGYVFSSESTTGLSN